METKSLISRPLSIPLNKFPTKVREWVASKFLNNLTPVLYKISVMLISVNRLHVTPDMIIPENVKIIKSDDKGYFELEISGEEEVNTHLLKKGIALSEGEELE